MRKLIILLGLFGCFFCFYGLGAYLKTYPFSPGGTLYPLPSITTIHKQSSSVTVPPSSIPLPSQQAKAPAQAKPLAKAIEEDKGSALIERLQAGRLEPFSRMQESLERRFASEYPRQEQAALSEAASRMSILQAMSQYSKHALSVTELQSLAQFYQQKGEDADENPAVRRESWRNLLQIAGHFEESEYQKILSRAGRHLASASQEPNELLEEIFRAGTP